LGIMVTFPFYLFAMNAARPFEPKTAALQNPAQSD